MEPSVRSRRAGSVDWRAVGQLGRRLGLPVLFAVISVPFMIVPGVLLGDLPGDARLYVDATRAWLAGSDPWAVQGGGLFFAAPPPTLVALAPFALLPSGLGALALCVCIVAAAVATLRLLSLPWWWILFPPLAQAVVAGNVQVLLLPLMLSRPAAWLAPMLKVYAAVPLALLGQWKSLAIFLVVCLATAPLLPWALFFERLPSITATLAAQSPIGPSTTLALLTLPIAGACAWVVGRDAAAWLAVPAVWPSQQWYYATLVMPTRSTLVAAIIALPVPSSGLIAMLALAVVTAWQTRHDPESPVGRARRRMQRRSA